MQPRDPLEVQHYGIDQFKYEAPEILATVGDALKDIMGTSRDVVPKGFEKYDKYFDETEDEKERAVVIPRYNGPKNTRVDYYNLESNTFNVTGMVNHAQASCVYLQQDLSVQFDKTIAAGQIMAGYVENTFSKLIRPFSIQRQFKQMYWNSPQVSSRLKIDIEQHVKLAPYLCDAAVLRNHVKKKRVARTENMGGGIYRFTFNYSLYEPLLGFQSGYALLNASRPFNQQKMMYPLAIQDYTINVDSEIATDKLVKRLIRDRRMAHTDEMHEGIQESVAMIGAGNAAALNASNHRIHSFTLSKPKLISYSQDDALQANKTVSSVSLHAPIFEVYKEPLYLDISQATGCDYDGMFNAAATQNKIPIVLQDIEEKELKIRCSTSKGFPSYFMLYLEDFGQDYIDMMMVNNEDNDVGTDNLIGTHPKIFSLTIKIFGQDIPITKLLGIEELEYMTRKNCHASCDFKEHMSFDPIVLLKLEDLGLATESVGYPNIKRLEMEFDIKQILVPYRAHLSHDILQLNAYVCFVYENHVLEGNNNRMEFVWKS